MRPIIDIIISKYKSNNIIIATCVLIRLYMRCFFYVKINIYAAEFVHNALCFIQRKTKDIKRKFYLKDMSMLCWKCFIGVIPLYGSWGGTIYIKYNTHSKNNP